MGFSHSSLASPTQANSAVNIAALNATMGKAELSAVTTARIERRNLATRDSSRLQLAQTATAKKQAAADRTAKARAAKLDAYRKVTQGRAAALARAKAIAAKAELLKLQSATRAEFMLTGRYDITATFGMGGARWARNHTGTDFAADAGTRIGVVMKGEVIQAEYSGPYGNQVKVRHTDGTVTSYSHMSSFSVSVGDLVYAGDKLGEVGSTGNSTGPHLHFEVLPDGESPINPLPWLRDHGLNP